MKKQKGIALILALLVVSLVTAITVELSWRFDLSFNRASNRFAGAQAFSYLRGAEQLGYYVLSEDLKEDQEDGELVDSPDEMWAMDAPPWEAGENSDAWVKVKLEDAQGRFNLNSLHSKPGRARGTAVPDWQMWTGQQRRFIRLLQTLEIEEDVLVDLEMAKSITAAVIDWLDAPGDEGVDGTDQPRNYLGAEEDYYSRLEPPVTIPNGPMLSVTELRLVRGVTARLYRQLLPMVIALPRVGFAAGGEWEAPGLNINTMVPGLIWMFNEKSNLMPLMPDQAQMLSVMLGKPLINPDDDDNATVEIAVTEEGAMPPGVYKDAKQFVDDLKTFLGAAENQDGNGLTVQSSFFMLNAEVTIGESYIRQGNALLYRGSDGTVTTLRRTDANF